MSHSDTTSIKKIRFYIIFFVRKKYRRDAIRLTHTHISIYKRIIKEKYCWPSDGHKSIRQLILYYYTDREISFGPGKIHKIVMRIPCDE